MKRILALVCCVVLCLAGCSSQETKDVDVAALAGDLVEQLTFNGTMMRMDDAAVTNFYNFDSDQVEQVCVYIEETGFATGEEITVIKLKDSGYDIESVFDSRLADLVDRFDEGYGPEALARVEKAQTAKVGNYALLAVCDDPDQAVRLFEDAVAA